MAYKREDAHELVDLLTYFRNDLAQNDSKTGLPALDRIVEVINSPLFQSLLDIQDYYEVALETEARTHEAAALSESALLPKTPIEKKKTKKPKSKSDKKKHSEDDDHEDQGDEYIPPAPSQATPMSPYASNNRVMSPQMHGVRGGVGAGEEVVVSEDDLMSGGAAGAQQDQTTYEEIELRRGESGFGFTIAGGYDMPQYEGDASVYVTKIIPGGAAQKNGRLQVNDIIISVNGVSLENVAHDDAVNALKQSGNKMKLVVCRELLPVAAEASDVGSYERSSITSPPPPQQAPPPRPQQQPPPPPPKSSGRAPPPEVAEPPASIRSPPPKPPSYQVESEVEIVKPAGYTQGYGFSISGGPGNEVIEADGTVLQGIIVTRIIPGGLAEQHGGIREGDRLIEVNGRSLWTATHAEAVQLLKSSPNSVKLRLLLKETPLPGASYSSEQGSSRPDGDKKEKKGRGGLFKGRKGKK